MQKQAYPTISLGTKGNGIIDLFAEFDFNFFVK